MEAEEEVDEEVVDEVEDFINVTIRLIILTVSINNKHPDQRWRSILVKSSPSRMSGLMKFMLLFFEFHRPEITSWFTATSPQSQWSLLQVSKALLQSLLLLLLYYCYYFEVSLKRLRSGRDLGRRSGILGVLISNLRDL